MTSGMFNVCCLNCTLSIGVTPCYLTLLFDDQLYNSEILKNAVSSRQKHVKILLFDVFDAIFLNCFQHGSSSTVDFTTDCCSDKKWKRNLITNLAFQRSLERILRSEWREKTSKKRAETDFKLVSENSKLQIERDVDFERHTTRQKISKSCRKLNLTFKMHKTQNFGCCKNENFLIEKTKSTTKNDV